MTTVEHDAESSKKPATTADRATDLSTSSQSMTLPWPKTGVTVPLQSQIESSFQYRFARQIDLAIRAPAMEESNCDIDLRIFCSIRRVIGICSTQNEMNGYIHEIVNLSNVDSDLHCIQPILPIKESLLNNSGLCQKESNVVDWKQVLDKLEQAGIWKMKSRWSGGDAAGPNVLFRYRRKNSAEVAISTSNYVGEDAVTERKVVRVLNDYQLCSPRPPG